MKLILGVALTIGVSAAHAQLVIGPSFTATENFDGLPSSGTPTSPFSATIGVQAAVPGTTFDGAKIAGTGTTAMPFIVSDGSNFSGGIHSLGAVDNTERALGMLASGSNAPAVGVRLVNNSGIELISVKVSFTQETWRSSTSVRNTITAAWSTTSTDATYLTDSANFTAVSALDLVGPDAVTTNGALNGNDPANQTARTFTFDFATNPLANGATLYLRWSDVNDPGSDAALALDNFVVEATPIPEPATMTALALAAALAAARKRRKA